MTHRLARLVAFNPQRRTVDVVFMDDRQRCREMPVMPDSAGSDHGSWRVPSMPRPASETDAARIAGTGRTVIAVAGTISGQPIVTDFMQPSGATANTTKADRWFERHPSGSYTSIGPNGSIEAFYPGAGCSGSGRATMRQSPAWRRPQPAPLRLADGFSMIVKPGGVYELTAAGSLTMTFARAELRGDVSVHGNLGVVDGDVAADGVSLKNHHHGAVQPGSGQSGPPAP